MKTADQMIDDIIRREGGYVNHPADSGGPTKYGITLKTLQSWFPTIDEEDVKELSEETARTIYKIQYYSKPKIHELPPAIQPFVFDSAVQHGPKQAVKFLQQACCDFDQDLEVDGVIGPMTRNAAINVFAKHGVALISQMAYRRRQFYNAIVVNDPGQRVFLKGWLNRVAEFEPTVGENATTLDMWKARALAAEAALAEVEAVLIAFRRVA